MHSVGPLLGLALSCFLIIKSVPAIWSLLLGAAVGGILSGVGLVGTGCAMLRGGVEMLPSAACILASGVLAGALVKTGSAERIARTVLEKLGTRWAIPAVAVAVMLLTACGVFVDIAVITAAPIALRIGSKANRGPGTILLAMIGGGKAGNIISPNPNTIAAAKAFDLELTQLMAVNLLPALCALLVTVLIASAFRDDGSCTADLQPESVELPGFRTAVSGPAAVLLLLVLRPVFGIQIDPILALPVGGLVCMAATSAWKQGREMVVFGLREVSGVALVLVGTGTLAGVIQASNLQADIIRGLEILHLPPFLLAPLAGILMGGAASSTTAGTAIASRAFGPTLVGAGVPALSAAAMVHAGATVLDSLPHGSFFHATAGCVGLGWKQRLRLLPWEAAIGGTSVLVAVLIYMLQLRKYL